MKKVLVVDDNQNNKITLELLLEEFGVEILSAENGKEAVEICQNTQIDLIFMDLMMPIMDGIEATRLIREFDKKVMIVAVTALDDDISKEKMLKFGAEDYIRKPINPDIFTRRTKNYLEIIELRTNIGKNSNEKALNLFDDNVFYRTCSFRIENQQALAEFWEYYLADSAKRVANISDCVRVIYAFGSYLIKAGCTGFRIVSEESEKNLYLTLKGVGRVSPVVVRNILLKNYPQGIYKFQEEFLSFSLKKDIEETQGSSLNEEEKEALKGSGSRRISAKEYVQDTPFALMGKIDQLEDQEEKIDFAISDFGNKPTKTNLSNVANHLISYNEVIHNLFEFQHLAFAIDSLANMLNRLEESKLDENSVKKMTSLLGNVLADLSSWRKAIFIDQEAQDIHYLDASLLSSCLQIEMIFEDRKIEDDDNSIEFF